MKTAVVGFQQEKLRRRPPSGLLWILALTLVVAGNARGARADEPLLVAHWKLATDARDSAGNDLHATNHGVRFSEGAAVFNGKDAYLEVADSEHLRPGTGDFTISVRVHTEQKLTDVLGDVLSKFQPATRTGVVRNDGFDPEAFDLDNDQPLRIGFGEHDYFNGKMQDLRIYSGVLSDAAIAAAAR